VVSINDIKNDLEKLKTLEIRTIIGNVEYEPKNKKIKEADGAKVIVTQIDLLEGDIVTAFGEDFLKPPYDEIRKYHTEREKQGQEIIASNIKILKDFVELIKDINEQKETVDGEIGSE